MNPTDSGHDELRDLLTDAVADVEPEYRLDTIRARTQRPQRRRGWYLTGGAILAAASVVAAVNLGQNNGGRPDTVPPAGQGERKAVALYFVGDTPMGPRLYREYQQLPSDPLAALEAITTAGGPDDPDYRAFWPPGYFRSISVKGGKIEIQLGTWDPDVSRGEERLYINQIIYTAQAAIGEPLPVVLLGKLTADDPGFVAEHERASQNEVLSLVSISDPVEGLHVTDVFVARGRANSDEANVPWEIQNESGDMVLDGFVTALGWQDHLYEWETDPIDVSQLPPGTYTFIASTSDPSGGAEGPGPFTDTRTIIVE